MLRLFTGQVQFFNQSVKPVTINNNQEKKTQQQDRESELAGSAAQGHFVKAQSTMIR